MNKAIYQLNLREGDLWGRNEPEPLMVLPGIMVFANKFSANGEYL